MRPDLICQIRIDKEFNELKIDHFKLRLDLGVQDKTRVDKVCFLFGEGATLKKTLKNL